MTKKKTKKSLLDDLKSEAPARYPRLPAAAIEEIREVRDEIRAGRLYYSKIQVARVMKERYDLPMPIRTICDRMTRLFEHDGGWR